MAPGGKERKRQRVTRYRYNAAAVMSVFCLWLCPWMVHVCEASLMQVGGPRFDQHPHPLPVKPYWADGNDGKDIPNLSVSYPGQHPYERRLLQNNNNEQVREEEDNVSKYGVRPTYNSPSENDNLQEDPSSTSASEREDPAISAGTQNRFSDDDFGRENLLYDHSYEQIFRNNNDYDHDSRGYQPLRIHFITSPLQAQRGKSAAIDAQIEDILTRALPRAAEAWSRHLSVYPVAGSISIPEDVCYGTFVNDIPPDATQVTNADLVMIVSAYNTLATPDGNTSPVCLNTQSLASGGACALDQWDRPIIGFINICLQPENTESTLTLDQIVSNAFQETQRSHRQNIDTTKRVDLETVLIHELGHSLGFDSYLFKFFRNATTGEPLTPRPFQMSTVTCTNRAGPSEQVGFPSDNVLKPGRTAQGHLYFDIVTPRVAQIARNHFNCPSLTGARLENYESSCVGSHWDERLFSNDILSPALAWTNNVLSPLTLAFMEDTGWYKVNYQNVSIPSFGLGAGCEFVSGNCIVDDKVPAFGKDYFCDHPIRLQKGLLQMEEESLNKITCDPSHQYWAMCDLWDTQSIPAFFEARFPQGKSSYFSDSSLQVSFPQADFCPMAMEFLGVDCTKEPESINGYFLAQQFTYQGEQMGPSSRCINAFSDISTDRNQRLDRPACMHVECDPNLRKVVMGFGEHQYICDYDGQVQHISGSEADFLECPRLATICPHLFCPSSCSGRGICDYDADSHPKCRCFDPENTSEGCYPNHEDSNPLPEAEEDGLWLDLSSGVGQGACLCLFSVISSVLLMFSFHVY